MHSSPSPFCYYENELADHDGTCLLYTSNEARKVVISKGNDNINLIIGSPIMYVNKTAVTMDVPPEITNNRTFLPARWVAEALGAQVEWDDTAKQAIIKMPIVEPGN